MTANELIDYIADLVNQSSADAKERIGRSLNVRYRQVTSSIGLAATRRSTITTTSTIGSQFIVFTGNEKLEIVYRKVGTKIYPLDELTNDEMNNTNLRTEPPHSYSIYSVTPDTVTLKVDCIATTTYTLYADVLTDATTITNTDRPAFPESYHDVLVQGVVADELGRKEKFDQAAAAEAKFEKRLSDLRMFMAKSTYLTIYRDKHGSNDGWWDSRIMRQ